MKLSQMELVMAILNEIERQLPGARISQRTANLIIESATEIVKQAAIPFRAETPGMGLSRWLESDDTGLSSKWMAHVVYAGPHCEPNFPRDTSDLGRCLRLILACGKPDPEKLASLLAMEGWEQWSDQLLGAHARWAELQEAANRPNPSGNR